MHHSRGMVRRIRRRARLGCGALVRHSWSTASIHWHVFNFRADSEDNGGPDESGVLPVRYVGWPASVAERSCITPSIWPKGYEGGPAWYRALVRHSWTPSTTGVHGFKFRANGRQDESGVLGYVGGPALDAGLSCVTLGVWFLV